MPATGTVNEVIESASRRGNIPNSQMTYLTTDFLAIMAEELAAYAMPILHARREDYYLEEMYFDMNAPDAYIGNPGGVQDRAWILPEWAMTSSLRDVQAVDPSGAFYSLARIQTDNVPNSVSQGWYFYGNYLAFHYNNISPAPPPLSIRCIYHVRPNQLIVAEDGILIERIIVPGQQYLVSMEHPQGIQNDAALEQCFHAYLTPVADTIKASFSQLPNKYTLDSTTYYSFDVVDQYTWAVKQYSLNVKWNSDPAFPVDPAYPTWGTCIGTVLAADIAAGKVLPNQGDWLVPHGMTLPTFSYDIIRGKPGYDVLKRGISFSINPVPVSTGTNLQFPTWSQYLISIAPGTLPDTLPFTMPTSGTMPILSSAVQVGDWFCPAGTTCVVPLPLEMHPLLAQRMVVKFLEAQGDQEQLSQSRNSLSEMANQIPLLIQPRAEGKPKKIVNAVGHWRRWRW